jgi:hypothetical protein
MGVRQRVRNALFTTFYPGRYMGTPLPAPKDAVSIAVPDDGEFVSVCTAEGCAVFHTAKELRDLADTLYEVADLLEEKQLKAKER